MNKKLRVVLAVLATIIIVLMMVFPVFAQSPVPGEQAVETLRWPCGSEKTPGITDIDFQNSMDLKSLGFFKRSFYGNLGDCYAGKVKAWNFNQTGGTKIDVRIASSDIRHLFITTPYAIAIYGGGGANILGDFELYVPDSLVEKFTKLGFKPIAFSAVTDWSYEKMLGASKTDTVAQWIKRGLDMGNRNPDPLKRRIIVYSLRPLAKGVGVYFTWRPTK